MKRIFMDATFVTILMWYNVIVDKKIVGLYKSDKQPLIICYID